MPICPTCRAVLRQGRCPRGHTLVRRTDDSRGVGRPPVGPRITLRIPQDLVDRLDVAAEQRGTTRSELLRQGAELALSTAVEDQEQP